MQAHRAITNLYPQRTGRAARGGFSLIELVLVMLIISVLAAIAVPRYANALARYRVDAAASRVVADLEFAREQARATSTSVIVRVRTSNDRVKIFGVQDPDDPSIANTITYLAESPYRADVITSDFDGNEIVTFDGFGMPDDEGTVVLAVGSETRTIILDLDSGKAVVQ